VNHLCFYAFILGRETKLVIRWTDITELDKTSSLLFPDSIRIATREKEVCTGHYAHTSHTYKNLNSALDKNLIQFKLPFSL
jgi:hypothetical protein